MLHGQLGDTLICRGGKHQDRNLGRRAKEPIESFDASAIGKREVEKHRCYAVRSSPILLFFAGQSCQTLGAQASGPFDLERPIG